MKKNYLILIAIAGGIFVGCASVTGVTNWKENTFVSPLDCAATVKTATEAIARIGTVSFTDAATGTVNGDCGRHIEAAVTVFAENGRTMVIMKSRLNVEGSLVVWTTGDRQNCISHVVEEMKSLGCALSPQTP